jgi:hypothetical protein
MHENRLLKRSDPTLADGNRERVARASVQEKSMEKTKVNLQEVWLVSDLSGIQLETHDGLTHANRRAYH